MECKDEDLVLLATTIAMELAKGLSIEELEDLRNLVNQVSCSLTTLINNKYGVLKRRNKMVPPFK